MLFMGGGAAQALVHYRVKFYEKNMSSGGGKKVIQDRLNKADFVPVDFIGVNTYQSKDIYGVYKTTTQNTAS